MNRSPLLPAQTLPHWLPRLLPLLGAILLSGTLGCHDLKIPDGKLMCGAQMACPSPYHCVAGLCYAPGHEPGDGGTDASAKDGSANDASKDAPSSDKPQGDVGGSDGAPTADADTSIDAGSVEQGGACSADLHCMSGHCVDGVCCDTACDATCMACSALFTGGKDGTCAATKAGMNPHATRDCAAGKPEECGNDGTCDGAGACRLYGSTQVCAASSCTGAVGAQNFQGVSTCDGKGKCIAPAPEACGQYNCSPSGGCAKPCTTDDTCGTGNYCSAEGICRTKQIDGNACTAAKECAHGFCVDGFCCESDCTKKGCFSCARDYTGQANGQCQPVSKGKVSPRATDCKAADGKTCGLDGTCDGAGACKSFDSSTKCGDPSCAGTTFTATATCNGAGTCAPGPKTDCGQFQCSLSGCLKNCQLDTDCAAGSYCTADKTCAVKKTAGTACQATKECASGICVDGVCCGMACSQTCYGCSMEKTGKPDGTCAPLKAGTSRSATECPAAAMSSCGNDGTCDGAGKCHSWAQGTACAAGACSTSGFTGAKTCDGAGHCSGPATVSCGAYPCNATTGCAISCSASQPCGGDTYCDATTSRCTPKKSNGQNCQAAAECLTNQCVEGFCCNSACTGGCSSCAKALNGVADGTCSPIPNGQNPKTAGTCTANGCLQDGKCDGNNACRKTPKGTNCGSASCAQSGATVTYHGASTCDGSGGCSTPTNDDCNGYGCASATACRTSCSADNECLSGVTHCEAPACKADCTTQASCGSNSICSNKRCMSCGSMTACSNACVDTDSSTSNCGTCGHACSGTTNMCSGGKCVQCKVSTDCKGSGMTCVNGSCTCANGYHTCSGSTTCYADSDATKCGPACTDCSQPYVNAACGSGSSCANTCKVSAYKLACSTSIGGKADCAQWDFESGIEGWYVHNDPNNANAVVSLSRTTSQHTSGSASLAISFNNNGDSQKGIDVIVNLCASGQSLDLNGKYVQWTVKAPGAAASGGTYGYFTSESFGGFMDFNIPDEWGTFNNQIQQGPSGFVRSAIGFHFQFSGPFNGTIYLDDVTLSGG